MTDVVTKAQSGGDQEHNVVHVFSPRGNKKFTYGINQTMPVSGVNGVTDNGYLDGRFDDPRYYSGDTSS